MEIKQQLRMSQQLVMTPQLQQAIKLLQLARLEYVEELHKALDENPVLSDDNIDPSGKRAMEKDFGNAGSSTEQGEMRIELLDDRSRAQEGGTSLTADNKAVKEIDWEQFLENRTLQQSSGSRTGSDDMPGIEQTLTKAQTLVDHLRWQMQANDFTDTERTFAELVLGNIDENGFLDLKGIERDDGTRTPDITLEMLAEEAGLDPEDAAEVLRIMQELDPVGVCARDLRECLYVQAEMFHYDDLELTIIDKHLPNLERHNYQAIAKDLSIPVEQVYEAVKKIQKLESRPARNFSEVDDKSIGISPDVYVIRDDDKFVVTDNDRGVPRLYVNDDLAKQLLREPSAKEFVGEKLRAAQWLIRAIEQRRRTIIRVTECIVEKQREFFEKGVNYLKPMILRDVAETVGMHESTISRVTTNKYVHTPQGLFELKYFFNSSIRRNSEDDIASESVKQAIKKIIEAEDKQDPLSDQTIVEMLSDQEGVQIARRTVAKYREMLGILASSRRKKLF
jgi:RNA polymerase sigma-54 factor